MLAIMCNVKDVISKLIDFGTPLSIAHNISDTVSELSDHARPQFPSPSLQPNPPRTIAKPTILDPK